MMGSPRRTALSRGTTLSWRWTKTSRWLPAALAAFLLLAARCAEAQAPPRPPSLRPLGARPGERTELRVEGAGVEAAFAVWLRAAGDASLAPPDGSGSRALSVRLDAAATTGVALLRLGRLDGPTQALPFLIDNLPLVAVPGSQTRDAALRIEAPSAVEGVCEPEASAWWRVEARAGEELAVEVVAARLGSELDPYLRLVDARGAPLEVSDDAPGLGVDAALRHRAVTDGPLWIELRDTAFGGGGRCFFRLRLGDASVAAPGRGPGRPAAPGREPGAGAIDLFHVEAPPLEPLRGEAALPLPGSVWGAFEEPGARTTYAIDVAAQDVWVFAAESRSLGAPADAYLALLGSEGKLLAEADHRGATEPTLEHRFEEAGRYTLVVEELSGLGGPRRPYRLSARRPLPAEGLGLEVDAVGAPPGGEVALKVRCRRGKRKGPLEVRIVPPAPGLLAALEGKALARLDGDATSAEARIPIPPAAPVGTFLSFRLEAVAPSAGAAAGGGEAARTTGLGVGGSRSALSIDTAASLGAVFPRLRMPPAGCDGEVVVLVLPPVREF